ncbi:MAG TPA: phosphocholine cytidylyltransferase family protein [Mobilitalea sp.]|nr:phosphocholine cytidylyltransferase family protein [Mobilitalea sp.]
MKAILLAAGRGTRISRMVEHIPKCTLPINKKPLIRITAELLLKANFEITVCVGYKNDQIHKALKGLDIQYYENPFYDITNSIASLWFARESLAGDVLILNADVFFSEEILNRILADNRDVVMAIDTGRTVTGDYFFSTSDSGCIKKYGKDLPLTERSCEYVGIAKVSESFLPLLLQKMDVLIKNQKHHMWWEDVLYNLSAERDIYTVDIKGEFWSEIDYFDDYERILNYINGGIASGQS